MTKKCFSQQLPLKIIHCISPDFSTSSGRSGGPPMSGFNLHFRIPAGHFFYIISLSPSVR
jgi:hypothetical protein